MATTGVVRRLDALEQQVADLAKALPHLIDEVRRVRRLVVQLNRDDDALDEMDAEDEWREFCHGHGLSVDDWTSGDGERHVYVAGTSDRFWQHGDDVVLAALARTIRRHPEAEGVTSQEIIDVMYGPDGCDDTACGLGFRMFGLHRRGKVKRLPGTPRRWALPSVVSEAVR